LEVSILEFMKIPYIYDFWRLRSLEVTVLEVMNFGGYDLGGCEFPLYLRFLEVMIVGCFGFGGYEPWRIRFWSL
jgi:hypothetical protein